MNRIAKFLLPILAVALLPAGAGASVIDGVWRSPESKRGSYLHVRVQPCSRAGEARCGIVTGAFAGAKPDAIGRQVMRGMLPQADGTWKGEVIQPLKGEIYRSRIRAGRPGVMEVDGCMLGGLICRTQEWTRVE